MYAIISELDEQSSAKVIEFWKTLREACGLRGIYDIPTPHFTWFVAEQMDVEKTKPIISQIVKNVDPFEIRTFGLGVFSGKQPVLYLPMVKTRQVLNFHDEIWEKLRPHSTDSQLYYSPWLWVPHITLAIKDLTRENLSCAINAIAYEPIELINYVSNLILADYEDERPGQMLERFPFRSLDTRSKL